MASDPTRPNRPATYADAGVDIDAGNRLVDLIAPLAKATRRAGADASLGGFGGLFDLKAAGFSDPLLVGATDGVGTKLRLAIDAGRHDTVGVDLVSMCVNDLVVQGAEPLFFLDYFATGKLSVETAADVVKGVAEGCRQAGAALIGGETAEMPGMYGDGDYDLAGFAVGAVERDGLLPRSDLAVGDRLLGLASSGFHSNGFSLVRRLLEQQGLGLDARFPGDGRPVADVLLEPTRIYVKPLLEVIRSSAALKALSHITGGGLAENPPRVLPEGLAARIDLGAWPLPAPFVWAREAGAMETTELLRTFNCGIGMLLVVGADDADPVAARLAEAGETVHHIGELVPRAAEPVEFTGAFVEAIP